MHALIWIENSIVSDRNRDINLRFDEKTLEHPCRQTDVYLVD